MFIPKFYITAKIANILVKIEAIRQEIAHLPITPTVLASLRQTARLHSTHYSTMIEGNRLSEHEVEEVIHGMGRFPGRERDEKEVLGYYAALDEVDKMARSKEMVNEATIKMLHALVISGGKKKVKPTQYRDGQNIIKDMTTRRIVYLPPQSEDVPQLMKDLVVWLNDAQTEHLVGPLQAAIAHYQFATIHPYYDGNGRTARLLTTLILHKVGYGLKGLYSLEEYYARNLHDYYEALTIGPSHNYYEGRAEADITSWIEYFCEGMLSSFEKVRNKTLLAYDSKATDKSITLSMLDTRKRVVLSLFEEKSVVTAIDIEQCFKFKPRTARSLCQQWVKEGFFIILDSSKKKRSYRISPRMRKLLDLL